MTAPPTTTSKEAVVVSLAHRLDGLDKATVWQEFSPLAVQYGAVNLGQGFPDWDPPTFASDAMTRSVVPSYQRHANQYARSHAHLPLAQVLAKQYTERWKQSLGRHDIDPVTEIATAVGCTNVLYCAVQGLISSGDEVILLEPAFDIVRRILFDWRF
jgi:aspartate/methionine/tyrosine aminotransferase